MTLLLLTTLAWGSEESAPEPWWIYPGVDPDFGTLDPATSWPEYLEEQRGLTGTEAMLLAALSVPRASTPNQLRADLAAVAEQRRGLGRSAESRCIQGAADLAIGELADSTERLKQAKPRTESAQLADAQCLFLIAMTLDHVERQWPGKGGPLLLEASAQFHARYGSVGSMLDEAFYLFECDQHRRDLNLSAEVTTLLHLAMGPEGAARDWAEALLPERWEILNLFWLHDETDEGPIIRRVQIYDRVREAHALGDRASGLVSLGTEYIRRLQLRQAEEPHDTANQAAQIALFIGQLYAKHSDFESAEPWFRHSLEIALNVEAYLGLQGLFLEDLDYKAFYALKEEYPRVLIFERRTGETCLFPSDTPLGPAGVILPEQPSLSSPEGN